MNKGIVKWFDAKKGYGFIGEENGEDIFVHWTGIIGNGGFRYLNKDDRVAFDTTEREGRPNAINVVLDNMAD